MSRLLPISTGGILIKDEKVLLVQVNYGSNKGLWMLPGGIVEEGESLEDAVVREIHEETGITVQPSRVIGIRSGVRQVGNHAETGIYIVFEVDYVSGETRALDANEISAIKYAPINDVLEDLTVIDLSKHFIKATIETKTGLFKVSESFSTNNKYLSYAVYLAGN